MANVLIVDDQRNIRETFASFLKKEGHMIDTADNAKFALNLIKDRKYDVILTDLIMPQMSGIELVSKLNNLGNSAQIILMTGYPTIDSSLDAMKLGAIDYIVKPINKLTLIHSINKALLKNIFININKYLSSLDWVFNNGISKVNFEMKMNSLGLILANLELYNLNIARHQKRVGNLAADVSKIMKLDKFTSEQIRVAGYLHDIGKVETARSTQKHVDDSYNILRELSLPMNICRIVSQHHEKINGSGYPSGLIGDQIDIGAQIIGIANDFDLITTRHYFGTHGIYTDFFSNKNMYDSKIINAFKIIFDNCDYVISEEYIVYEINKE